MVIIGAVLDVVQVLDAMTGMLGIGNTTLPLKITGPVPVGFHLFPLVQGQLSMLFFLFQNLLDPLSQSDQVDLGLHH